MKEYIKTGADKVFFMLLQLGLFSRHGIRILMYHATPRDPVGKERVFLSVSEKSLRLQFEMIKELGYKVISLEQASRILNKGRNIEENYLVISFDDFYENNFQVALPLLEKFGFKAAFFPVTAYLDSETPFPWNENGERYGKPGTKKMIREIFSLGHEIGSHTHSHPRLADLSEEELTEELVESKTILEDIVQAPIKLFSYPSGDLKSFNPWVKQRLGELGYLCSLTTLEGINPPSAGLFSLKRTGIAEQDGPQIFSKKLRGMRDWFVLRQLLQGI